MSRRYNISDLPIQKKLWLFNLLTSLISGLFAVLLLALIVWQLEHKKGEHAARITAAIIAENAMPALQFHDKRTAEEVLAGLGRDAQIVSARIIEPSGHAFAAFFAAGISPGVASADASPRHVRVTVPMQAGGIQLATLELTSDRGYVVEQIMTYIAAVGLATVMSLVVSSFVGVRLQRAITRPLSALVALMKRVSVGGDLSQRAAVAGRDELGALGESFNRMIEQIEHRNTTLRLELTERRRAETQLEHLAHHDQVTGLPNRHFFRRRAAELARDKSARDGTRALLFIDLDNFKYINDTFGHDCGDQLLVVVAQRLSTSVRNVDLVVRFGGDEFVILLEQVKDLEQARRRSDELREAITQPFMLGEREFFVTCSIGVAMEPDNSGNFDDLLQKADAAMYVAKNGGKNGICLWQPAMSTASRARFELEADLHQALGRNELEMHYQPILNLVTGRIAGMEALMRWRHPSRGLVAPSVFIPIAEDSGLILTLGEWAMRTAFNQMAAWNLQFGPMFVAVNISGRQLRDPAFAARSEAIAKASGLARQLCELEVTESILMEPASEAIGLLKKLTDYGFSISLDDFGTGYSSLAYLKHFSLNKLKIDRSFVTELPHAVQDAAICKAIVLMSKSLSLRNVAEGIETASQAAALRQLGCQYGQGYYFSPALPVDQMTAFVSENQCEAQQAA